MAEREGRGTPRRLPRVMLALALLLLALLVQVAVLGLTLPEGLVSRLAASLVDPALEGRIRARTARISPSGAISLGGVVVLDPRGEAVLRARSIDVELAPRPLLRRHVELRSVRVEELEVVLVPPPPGSATTAPLTLLEVFQPRGDPALRSTPPALRGTDQDSAREREPRGGGGAPGGPAWTVSVSQVELGGGAALLLTSDLSASARRLRLEDGYLEYSPEHLRAGGSSSFEVMVEGSAGGSIPTVGPVLVELRAEYSSDRGPGGGTVTLTHATMTVPGARVSARGTVDLAGAAPADPPNPPAGDPSAARGELLATISLELDAPEVRALLPESVEGPLEPRGELDLELELLLGPRGGGPAPPERPPSLDLRAHLSFLGTGLSLAGIPITSAKGSASLLGSTLTLEALELSGRPGRARASGTGYVTTADGSVGVAACLSEWTGCGLGYELTVALAPLYPRELLRALEGVLPAALRASSERLAPRLLRGSLSVARPTSSPHTRVRTSLSLQGLPAPLARELGSSAELSAELGLSPARLEVQRLTLLAGAASLELRGDVHLGARPRLALDLQGRARAELPALSRLGAVRPEVLELSASVAGTPGDPTASGSLSARGLDLPVAGRASLRVPFTFGQGLVSTDGARVDLPVGEVWVAGWLRLLEGGRLAASPEHHLVLTAPELQLGALTGGAVVASARAEGTLRGTGADWRGLLHADLDGLRIRGATLAASRVELSIDPDRVVLGPLVLESELGGRLTLSATATLANRTVVAEVNASALSPALLARLAGRAPELDVGGSVDLSARGWVRLGGAPGRSGLTAAVEVSALEVSIEAERLSLVRPVSVSFDGETLRVDHLELSGPSGDFVAEATLGARSVVDARGLVNLAILEPFVAPVSAIRGKAEVALSLRGEVLSGDVVLAGPTRVRPRGMVREVVLESGRVHLTESMVTLEQLSGTVGQGRFRARGNVALRGFELGRHHLWFEGDDLPFRRSGVFLEGDARLEVVGAGRSSTIRGDVTLTRGRVERNLRLDQLTLRAVRGREPPADPPPAWLGQIELDLHAESAGPINVRAHADLFDLDAGILVDVYARGTLLEPELEGRIRVDEGELRFPEARLSIRDGAIDFVPGLPKGENPTVDLIAEGELSRRPDLGLPPRVTLRLHGPLDALELELSSDFGARDQTSLLAMLVTGRSVDELLSGASGGGGATLVDPSVAFVGSPLAGLATGQLESLLDRALNLDLDLSTELSAERLRVTAARQISARLRVEGGYERLMAAPIFAASASVMLFISSSLFLEGSARGVSAPDPSLLSLLESRPSGLELQLRVIGH